MTPTTPPRLAVRAIILHENRLLLVNAWPAGKSDLMCAPGGGVERGSSLPDNLIREVFEETGLRIIVGRPCLVNEFHDPKGSFHQVDVYFYCTLSGAPTLDHDWQDVDAIVTDRRWVTRQQMAHIRTKPDSLAAVAWRDADAPMYDPLEPLIV
ncbi:NUDIX domain-containing protein [Sulfitobacter guttiformis]|uniref:ADP-ribose pyrophosphatase YjhB (NUDIX family) n=1 Tax=Sulfitobacter guttiformis TaxID=74349 RepID=A0A420DPX8_9RHOB|nr:NUDIX hydrolase [Sulfitobacter guttiformis]KIN73696.1 NUDIX hydrolase, MutT [Sulfitobacter guttiformis KCTC 32187]RKE96336.1 ADP-ribose pyrophosphatase YjhB (NUDIX family) [Sulfitobacter guttiformis]